MYTHMHDNHFPTIIVLSCLYGFLIGSLMDIIYQIIITRLGITSNSNTKEHRYTISAIISNIIHLILRKNNVFTSLMNDIIDPSLLNLEEFVNIKTFPIHYQELQMNTKITK